MPRHGEPEKNEQSACLCEERSDAAISSRFLKSRNSILSGSHAAYGNQGNIPGFRCTASGLQLLFLLSPVGLTFFVTLGVLRHRFGPVLFQVREEWLISSGSHAAHGTHGKCRAMGEPGKNEQSARLCEERSDAAISSRFLKNRNFILFPFSRRDVIHSFQLVMDSPLYERGTNFNFRRNGFDWFR